MNEPSRVVLTFWGVLVGATALMLAARLSRTEEPRASVRGPEQHLARVAASTRLEAASDDRALLLMWRPTEDCGRYLGLAVATGWSRSGEIVGAETQLAFSLDAYAQLGPRQPSRQPLPAVLMSRHAPRSDMVRPGDPRRLFVVLGRGASAESAEGEISISNVAGREEGATALAFHRRFGELVGQDSCDLSAPEAQRLALFETLLRARVCDSQEPVFCRDAVLTLLPSAGEGRWRARVEPQGETHAAEFELTLELSGEGGPERLRLGRLAAPAGVSWTAWLSVHPPRSPREPMAAPRDELSSRPGPAGTDRSTVSIELRDLVEASGWGRVTQPWR